MSDTLIVAIDSEAGIVSARQAGRRAAEPLGFRRTELTLIATAISEVARNVLKYAKRGEIHIRVVQQGARAGVEITAQDQGPGIPDIEAAFRDGFSTGGGLGLGLPGARRIMDEMHIDSEVGVGTRIVMRKWSA